MALTSELRSCWLIPVPLTVAAFEGTDRAAAVRPPARTMRRKMSRFTRRALYKVPPPVPTSASGISSSITARTASGAEAPLVRGTSSWAALSR
jgi:hypothetical protein